MNISLSLLQIGLVIFIICAIITIICFIISTITDNLSLKNAAEIVFCIGITSCLVFYVAHINTQLNETSSNLQEQIEELEKERALAQQMIDNGANVYLDGQLIDGTKIILDKYDITIVDDYIILND